MSTAICTAIGGGTAVRIVQREITFFFYARDDILTPILTPDNILIAAFIRAAVKPYYGLIGNK